MTQSAMTGHTGWNQQAPNNANFQPMTGEDMFEMIEENGGAGEWESEEDGDSVPRWLFPRFPGAESIGTCSDEVGDVPTGHEGVHHKTDECGENFAADPGSMYLSRAGLNGMDTDVETLVDWLDAPRGIVGAINLEGEPGTGKTILLEAAATHAERRILPHLCTPDDTRETLLLRFVGEGKGECITEGHDHAPGQVEDEHCVLSPYTYGSLAYAAKHGMIWYGDEWQMLQDGVKVILYSATDGRPYLPGGSIDGRDLRFHPDFRVVLSSNPKVRGASIPEPMASRTAGTTLTVETSGNMLRDLAIDEVIVAAWEALGTQGLFRPQIRELRVADYWLSRGPQYATQAASALVPGHCPESERAAVRNIVISFVGGNLRADGRLVVQ